MRILARKLLEAKTEDVLSNFVGQFELQFDDGEIVQASGLDIIVSRYTWEFLKVFDKIPLLKDYFIRAHTKDNVAITASSFRNLLSKIMVDIFDSYSEFDDEHMNALQDTVWKLYMDIVTKINNDIMMFGCRYQMSSNIEDILDLVNDPEIIEIDEKNVVNADTVLDPNYVSNVYKKKEKVLLSERHKNNNITIMARAGVIKIPQLMQCMGPRGSVTDINSDIFKEPIPTGYFRGFRRIYDALIESRTAAMSLNNQSAPLQFTEYFSRRVQLIAMQLERLHFADCGSDHHLEIQVRGHRNNYVISDLELLEGMNYLDEEESNKLGYRVYKPVRRKDTHLIGKRLKIRTVLGCQHSDPSGVCSMCFGEASRSVPRYRNLGHFCVVLFTQIISQLVLSTKHHTSSAVSIAIALLDSAKEYLYEMEGGTSISIRDDIKKKYKSVKLGVAKESIDVLSDLTDMSDITLLSPSRTSQINRIKLTLVDNADNVIEEVLDVIPLTEVGFFSSSMLKHMKDNGWTIDDGEFVNIELLNFDSTLPLIEITPRQANMFQYAKGLEKLLKSSVEEIKKRATSVSPEAFLMELSDAVNQRLGINMSILQVIAYTMLGTDIENKDYSLPKPHTKHGLGSMDKLLQGRSLSAALAYERQGSLFNSPQSYKYTNRQDSPMDEFFVPEQMDLEYYH